MEQLKYDAFISYKQTPERKSIARELQRLIESYKPSKDANRSAFKRKVFLDQGDLGAGELNEQITNALQTSRFLIVLACPEYKTSPHTCNEFKEFISIHGENIIVVNIEGRPEDNLNDLRMWGLTKTVLAADISLHKQEEQPLKKKLKELQKIEIFRVLAELLGCDPDALIMREKKRRRNRMIQRGSLATVLILLITIGVLAYRLSEMNKAIDQLYNNAFSNLDKAEQSQDIITECLVFDDEYLDITKRASLVYKAVAPLYSIISHNSYKLDDTAYYESNQNVIEISTLDKLYLDQLYYQLGRIQQEYRLMYDDVQSFWSSEDPDFYTLIKLRVELVTLRTERLKYIIYLIFTDKGAVTLESISFEKIWADYVTLSEMINEKDEEFVYELRRKLECSNTGLDNIKKQLRPENDNNIETLVIKGRTAKNAGYTDIALDVYDAIRENITDEPWTALYAEVGTALAERSDISGGCFVVEIISGYEAERVGLQLGDIIVRYNGVTVSWPAELTEAVQQATEDCTIILFRLEDGALKQYTYKVKSGTLGVFSVVI